MYNLCEPLLEQVKLEENKLESAKRPREAGSSPESPGKSTGKFQKLQLSSKKGEMAKVGDMPVEVLKGVFQDMLNGALGNVATKDDVKQFQEEVRALRIENQELKEELGKMRSQLDYIDRERRQKRLVFHGLEDVQDVSSKVQEVLHSNLKVVEPVLVSKTTKMKSKNGKMSVLAEFVSCNDVWKVLGKCRNLAGSGIGVDRDLTIEERDQRRKLLHMKREIEKIDKSKRVSIQGSKLKIDGSFFTWKDNKHFVCGKESGLQALRKIYGKDFSDISFKLDYKRIDAKQ